MQMDRMQQMGYYTAGVHRLGTHKSHHGSHGRLHGGLGGLDAGAGSKKVFFGEDDEDENIEADIKAFEEGVDGQIAAELDEEESDERGDFGGNIGGSMSSISRLRRGHSGKQHL
eukprot:jgi/Hompol1/4335/HPOL_007053-RA